MESNGYSSMCKKFGEILGGKAKQEKEVCSVNLERTFEANLQGRNVHSIKGVNVTFESLDRQGKAINISETVLLEQEVPVFIHALVQQGLIISAVHNHWLYENPKLIYIHVQSLEPPLDFARKMSYAYSRLESRPRMK